MKRFILVLLLAVFLAGPACAFWPFGSSEKEKDIVSDRSLPIEQRIEAAFKDALGKSKAEQGFKLRVLSDCVQITYPISDGFSSDWIRKGVFRDTAKLMQKMKIFNRERAEEKKTEYNLDVMGQCPLVNKRTGEQTTETVIDLFMSAEVIRGWPEEGKAFDHNLIPQIADNYWLHRVLKD